LLPNGTYLAGRPVGPDILLGELIPPDLPQPFTAKEYAKAARQRLEMARRALNVLASLGLVERAGKAGRAYLYPLPAEVENG
ncbi:hypothetical protein, partial [Bittarella massiliensis (ex Durand et al. 2017)]|nr:hypothetical protein [Bittarella massiliensis (ex Durand et al. 2017)]